MTKPFDLQVLGERLKAQGVPLAEVALKKTIQEIFGWTDDSVDILATTQPLWAIAKAPLATAKAAALGEADKIDGVIGN